MNQELKALAEMAIKYEGRMFKADIVKISQGLLDTQKELAELKEKLNLIRLNCECAHLNSEEKNIICRSLLVTSARKDDL
jgi:hypothetical protein